MACTAESGSGIDWLSIFQIDKTDNESDVEFRYSELIRALEPVKNKFPEIQSALGLIEQAYSVFSGRHKRGEIDCRRFGSLRPCGSGKPFDIAHSKTKKGDTSKCSTGTKRIDWEELNERNSISNSQEQPLKRIRSLGGDAFEASSHTATRKTGLSEAEGSFGIVEAEFSNCSSVNHQNSRSPLITSELNREIYTANQYAGDVALSSGGQNEKQLNATSLGLAADGTSEGENASSRSSSEKLRNLTAVNAKEKVAEEIDSDIKFKYSELIRALEPVKNKFPEIQSALGLIGIAFSVFLDRDKRDERDCRRDGSLCPCGSVKQLDIAHSETMNTDKGATSKCFPGTKRIVREDSDESNPIPICSSAEQPLKRIRSLGGDVCEVIAEIQSPNDPIGKHCGQEVSSDTAENKTILNEVEAYWGRSSESPVKGMVQKEPSLEKMAEEIVYESDGVSFGGFMLDEFVCRNSLGYSDDAVNKLDDNENVTEDIDFRNHKKADVYKVGQFLAFYDQEKMPRLYARIDKIERCYKIETNCTESTLYVRWLRPISINQDEKNLHEAGLAVSCGLFKLHCDKIDKSNIALGNHPVISHVVSSFQEHGYPVFQLYPREGEVWALYKEWKPFDWCSDPETRKGCKFYLVEILSDYSTEADVKIAILVKVAGYETIFTRSSFSFQIAARYLFGFSHNIPVRSAGDMRGLFAGMVLDLDPFSIPDGVIVDTVAAEFSLTATTDKQKAAEEITSESHGVSLGGFTVNESGCGSTSCYTIVDGYKASRLERVANSLYLDGVSGKFGRRKRASA